MKIRFDKNLVSLISESAEETSSVEHLWRMLVDCVSRTRNLSPVGEYVPQKDNTAAFYVEGLSASASDIVLDHDGRVCCFVCNKTIDLRFHILIFNSRTPHSELHISDPLSRPIAMNPRALRRQRDVNHPE